AAMPYVLADIDSEAVGASAASEAGANQFMSNLSKLTAAASNLVAAMDGSGGFNLISRQQSHSSNSCGLDREPSWEREGFALRTGRCVITEKVGSAFCRNRACACR